MFETIAILLLLFPLIASALVLLSGNKWAKQAALIFTVIQFGITLYALYWFNAGQTWFDSTQMFVLKKEWITYPRISFHLGVDGLGMLMILLTNFLLPLIVLSSFNRTIVNAKSY